MRKAVTVKVPRDVLADAELAYDARCAHVDDPVERAEDTRILAQLLRRMGIRVGGQSRVVLAALNQAADRYEDEARAAERAVAEVPA